MLCRTCFKIYSAFETIPIRMVIGVASLPGGMLMGLEVIFEVAELRK